MAVEKGSVTPFCIAAAACCVQETLALYALCMHDFVPALTSHMAVILWQLLWLRRARHYRQFAMLLLVMTLVAGPLGCAICFMAALLYGGYSSRAVAPDEWIQSYFSYEEKEESERIRERIAFGLDNLKPSNDIEPLQDILETGTVLQKQMVIAKVMRYFCPQFAPFLLQALQDENAAVRVQAATAIAKIERDFMQQYITLENALKKASNPYETRFKLAQLYDSYAHTGLIDEDSRKMFREKAIALYETCMQEHSTSHLRHLLARLYVRHDSHEKAEKLLLADIETGGIAFPGILWYMEVLFQLRKFKQLRQVAARYIPRLKNEGNPLLMKEMENVLCTWSA